MDNKDFIVKELSYKYLTIEKELSYAKRTLKLINTELDKEEPDLILLKLWNYELPNCNNIINRLINETKSLEAKLSVYINNTTGCKSNN